MDSRKKSDNQFSLLLCPDPWEEQDEELLMSSEDVWHKVNPMIGVSVQPGFYEQEMQRSRLDPEKKKETITKLLNVFRSERTQEWVKPEQIRQLQVPTRIDQLSSEQGWMVFVGMDFSLGDDLHAQTYLCVNRKTGEFYADMDAWVTERALHASTVRSLFELWIEQGWLHLSPGETLQPDLPIGRIIELSEHLVLMRFGYDPYKAKQPINTLGAWIFSQGQKPESYIVPVRQNFGTYNPAVLELDYMMRRDPPMLHFSPNPMWPWEFGNCVLAESTDGMENRKPVKANPGADGCKVDNIQCLCTALLLYDQMDGQVQ